MQNIRTVILEHLWSRPALHVITVYGDKHTSWESPYELLSG